MDSTIKIEFVTSFRFASIIKVKIRKINQTSATQNGTTPAAYRYQTRFKRIEAIRTKGIFDRYQSVYTVVSESKTFVTKVVRSVRTPVTHW